MKKTSHKKILMEPDSVLGGGLGTCAPTTTSVLNREGQGGRVQWHGLAHGGSHRQQHLSTSAHLGFPRGWYPRRNLPGSSLQAQMK